MSFSGRALIYSLFPIQLIVAVVLTSSPAMAHRPNADLDGSADPVDVIHFNWVLKTFADAASIDLSCEAALAAHEPELIFDIRGRVETPALQMSENGYQCTPRMSGPNFCRASLNACRRRTLGAFPPMGSQDCWRWPGVSRGAASDSARMSSEAVRRRTMLYASEAFLNLKNDPILLDRCCGENTACRTHVRDTELEFMDGLPEHDRTAHYSWTRGEHGRIRVSTSYLMNALTSESVDWVLLHELGHACQYGKAVGVSGPESEEQEASEAAIRGLDTDQCDGGEGAFGYVTSLGFETGACIRNALEADRGRQTERGVSVCYSQWLEEAFASSVFAFRMNSIEHWAWMCRNTANGDHPEQRIFVECLLNDPVVRKNFCGG